MTKIGLGILSWKGAESLLSSLVSYKQENLFSLFDEKVIFLPEQREIETDIAREAGLTIFGHPQNLGILGGFKALAESMTAEYVLLLENDCPLIENYREAKRQIEHSVHLLETGKADIIRLRSRRFAGQDWETVRKYRAYYPEETASFPTKIISVFKRLCRPFKTSRLKAWSLYVSHKEVTKFPNHIVYDAENDIYTVSSRYMPWTNQSIFLRRDFFLNDIIKYAENAPTTRRINGFRNLEIEMNSAYWRNKNYTIAIPAGLFTHKRIGERGYSLR